jgi:DNA-binding NarL/FixJ family response regulator
MVGDAVVKVMLIDDHPLARQGLAATLGTARDLEVVAQAGGAAEAIALARGLEIDVAIVDMLLPGTSGISIAHDLHELKPRCYILGLSVIDEPGLIADMLRAGASGYALKTQAVEEIVEAIRQVAGGVRYLPPTVSRDAIEAELALESDLPLGRLTRREREIFELLIRGYSNSEIAGQLFIAQRTVETHRQRIIKKLSARSIFELQRIAARYGGLSA